MEMAIVKGSTLNKLTNKQSYFVIYELYGFQRFDNKMKQFNTFAANSPSLSDYYSPKNNSQKFAFPSSQNSGNDVSRTSALDPLRFINNVNEYYNKAYKIDKRIRQSKSKDILLEDEESNAEIQAQSRVSMLLSDVSVPTAPPLEIDPPRLYSLENNITQQILEMREQKISLMQQLSKILDTKNLFEHYLLKASRQKEDIETNMGSFRESPQNKSENTPKESEEFVPIHVSAPILKRNEELHLRLKQLQIKEQIFGPNFQESEEDRIKNQRLLQQIIHVRELNCNLKDQIAAKIKKGQVNQSRFVTFLPQDRQKHFENKTSNQEYQQLQDKYKKLQALNRQSVPKLTTQEADYLEFLRKQNRQLIQQAQSMLREKKNGNSSIMALQKQLEQNQRQKQTFLNELQKFKQTMKKIKQENQRLKYELSH